MNTWIAAWSGSVLAWLADYYLAATLLLLLAFVGWRWVRQPAHRISIAWTVMFELAVLAVICALPFWPKVPFITAAPKGAAAVAVAEPATAPEAPDMPNLRVRLPPMAGMHREKRIASDRALAKPSLPEVVPTSTPPVAPAPRFNWIELVTLAYLAGAAVVGLWLCWGAVATTWLCWRASPAGEALKAELWEIIGQKRGIPRLLVSSRIVSAVALGVLRPTIVLPEAMVQAGAPHTLRAVLLHEWAHIRHRDLWLLALGRCLLAVLFAHPLFWWLRRTIRGDQELLADAVAAGNNRHDYAEELVRLVRMSGDGSPRSVSAAVGIWEGSSTFSRRIAMLLDETFRADPTISRHWRFKALLAMAVVGAICSLVTLQPARSSGEQDKPVTKVEMKTNEKAAEKGGKKTTPSTTAEKKQKREISGQVVDRTGKGIGGADVGLQVSPWSRRELPASPLAVAKADAEGRFRLLVPEGHDLQRMDAVVWAMADGYQPWRPNPQSSLTKPITVKLMPTGGTVLRIVDEKGKPVSRVRVTVAAQNLARSVAFPIPPDWLDCMSGVSDADGRVRIANAIPAALAEVILQPSGQSPNVRLNGNFFLNHHPRPSAPHFTWTLPAKGNIAGRLDVQGGKLPADLKITITTESKMPNGNAYEVGTQGEARAAVDAEGRFKVEGIAAGPITILPFLDDRQPLREEVPADMTVKAGETTAISIPVRRGVRVRGMIRTQDTKKGVPDFSVELVYGRSARDQRYERVQKFELNTDKEGRFSAIVPSGLILVELNGLPDGYRAVEPWKHPKTWGAKVVVPAGVEAFDIEPFDLVAAVSLTGTLVDLDGLPLGEREWGVYGYPHIPGESPSGIMNCYSANVDQEGRFSGAYPQTFPPVRWTVSHRRWPTPHQDVEDKWNATVLSRSPFVLQVPVHGSVRADKAKQPKVRQTDTPPVANVEQPAPAPMDDRVVAVEGTVVDDETGRPVGDCVIQGGRVDKKDPTKIIWGDAEGGIYAPAEEARFRTDIAWGTGGRARVVAAGYLPQLILEKAPGDQVTDAMHCVVRLKRGRGISGRVLYHDGTPAANAGVFLVGRLPVMIGDGKALQYALKVDEKTKRGAYEKIEDKTVTKTVADAAGRFTLPGGGDDMKRVAVSAPRFDLWIVPIPEDVAARKAEFTIKLPAPGRLVLKYDIPGSEAKAKLFVQVDKSHDSPDWPFSMLTGPDNSHEPLVANQGQVVLDNLPPGKYMLGRQKTYSFCDYRTVVVESGKTTTSEFVRNHGTAVVGRIVGLKPGMSINSNGDPRPGATVSVRPVSVKGDLISTAFSGQILPVFDALTCGLDGKFNTERLLPGKYAIIAEAYVPEKPEDLPPPPDDSDVPTGHVVLPAFVGRTVVTVHESGEPPRVTVELRPREKTPPAK